MPWYSARILFESSVERSPGHRVRGRILYDDCIFLVHAPDMRKALRKAMKRARKVHEHSYKNMYGQTVSWRVKKPLHIIKLFDAKIKDGTEVYWRLHEGWDPQWRVGKHLGIDW